MAPRNDPRPPAVKICGLRRREDLEVAVDAGAAFAGLVFAESPRRVTPEDAAPLAGAAREGGALPVGVFVDRAPDEVARVAERVGLAVVQLHGDEGPEACRSLRAEGLRVWKALRPRDRGELLEALDRYAGVADALLMEGFSPERAGGTGTPLPHGWLRDEDGSKLYEPMVLAGGLTPENVAEAVRRVEPEVVDVSSGVEREPGVKDPELIRRFVRRARSPGEAGS